MIELHHIYIAAFAVTAGLSLTVAGLSWRHRDAPGASAVVALMIGVTYWCVTEMLYWWTEVAAEQKFWLVMTFPGVLIVVVSVLVFAFEVGGMERWHTPQRVLLVSTAPVASCVIAMTNPGGLFLTSYTVTQLGPHTYYVPQNGPLFWVYLVVQYGTLTIGFLLIGRTYFRSSGSLRIRSGTGLVGVFVPFVVSVANQLSPHPIEGLEAAAFLFTGLAFGYAVVEGQVLDTSGHLVTPADMARANQFQKLLVTANEGLSDKLDEAALAVEALYDQATRDPLTGLYNRRALSEYLTREMARSSRTLAPVALVMLDIDHFKQVNDSFSHAAGDAALSLVGENLLRNARTMDTVCRYGGDEFLIIMPGADIDAAFQRAEELRTRIDGVTLHHDGEDIPLSVSAGVSASPQNGATAAEIMSAADAALHEAKESGRGKTVAA